MEFTLAGGLGYTPITINGLENPQNWELQKNVNDCWEMVDQSVHGNDYWQAYSDVDAGSYTLIYNVHNRGTNTYRLVKVTVKSVVT